MIKLTVIGLDGACFPLIGPWLEKGELPHMRFLVENGVSAEMESCYPPVTCPNWKCYSTGKNPGRLGIFWWENFDPHTGRVMIPNASMIQSNEIWDYLNQAGYRTGVIGMPLTFPPRKIDGVMITGGPESGHTGYTYPPSLQEELEKRLGYRSASLPFSKIERDQQIADGSLNLIDQNFQAAAYILQKESLDFLQITSFHLNVFQHFFHDGLPSKRAWKLVDKRLGEILDKSEYVMIMSDHGTARLQKYWSINSFLIKKGYMKLKKKTVLSQLLYKVGVTRSGLSSVLERFGLKDFLKNTRFFRRINKSLSGGFGLLGGHSGSFILSQIDWNKTKAVGLPQGPLYINRGLVVSDQEYEDLCQTLKEEIEILVDPISRERLVDRVVRKEEIYHGEFMDRAPDLIVLDADNYHNRASIFEKDFSEDPSWKGDNARYGLFIMYGPGVKKGLRLEPVSILDLAPTILHLYNIDIPEDMDGRVLLNAFEQDSVFAKRKPIYQPAKAYSAAISNPDEDEIRKRLKDLGYL